MIKAEKIIMRRQGFIKTHNKSGSITATPGWKTRQPRGHWTELPQGTQNTETLDNHKNPTATRRQSTRCSSQTKMSLVLSSRRKDKGDPELRSMKVRRKRSPTLLPYTQSNYITI